MAPKTAQELRQLAKDIEELVNKSPVLSIAGGPTRVLTDHLSAIARIHELQAMMYDQV